MTVTWDISQKFEYSRRLSGFVRKLRNDNHDQRKKRGGDHPQDLQLVPQVQDQENTRHGPAGKRQRLA
jgi:hypothetical protein